MRTTAIAIVLLSLALLSIFILAFFTQGTSLTIDKFFSFLVINDDLFEYLIYIIVIVEMISIIWFLDYIQKKMEM